MILLWDVMDTLVCDPFRHVVAPHFGLSFEELLARKHPTAWGEFERGEIDEPTFYAKFFRDGRPIDGPALKRRMADSYCWMDGMEALLAELSAREIPMHTLSNYPRWYELIEQRLGLGRYVRWTFVSCKTGLRKPALEAYGHAIESLGVDAAECLFIDDRERNCAAARQVGMAAILFTGNAATLRTKLARRGIL